MGINHKIHIGFNFHVDFYHSDRGDTNDAVGFGRDLIMVRNILEILGNANNEGQPVKAAWDFEREYTLGRILPSLGPDVIEGVKTRLRERGDELLFSGSHADMFAAMSGSEVRAAVRKALTGRVDVLSDDPAAPVKPDKIVNALGEPSMVLCPDAFVFSPSIIEDLTKSGVSAVILGNSCVGPDAMTTVAGELRKSPYVSYNPVTYRHASASMTLIPSYSPGEFMDAGNLTIFLNDLREKQISGDIEGDIFILISADARSAWWDSMGVKGFLSVVPGTEGLAGFLKELRKLDYIAYNTPSGYLRDHAPVSEVSFAGDVAAGKFSDLSTWGETPAGRMIWTRLERARIGSRVYSKERLSDSLTKRVELISARNFGEALPAPTKDRLAQMNQLSADIQKIERKAINEKEMSMRTSGRQRLNNSAIGKHLYSRRKDDEERNSFIIMNPKGQRTVSYQLEIESGQCPKISTLVLECDECQIDSYTAFESMSDGKFVTGVFVLMRFAEAQNTYKIYYHFDRSDIPKEPHKPIIEVKPEDIPVFHAEGAMKRLLEAQGKLQKPVEEKKDDTNPAVAERIAAMNTAAGQGKGADPVKTEKETYVIESAGRKLRLIVTGTGAGKGKIREVFYGDERIGDDQFLMSYVKAGGKVSEFECTAVEAVQVAGSGEGVRISGEIHAKGESVPGKYSLSIIATNALKGADGVLIYSDVQYPEIHAGADNELEEVAPLQISPLYRAGVGVIRRAFTGDVSDYPVSCFGKAVRENANISSFNHQLTAGVVGVKGALSGIVIAHSRQMLGAIAGCPGRLLTDGEGQHLSLNPFGSYGGGHREYPTVSEGLIQRYSDIAVTGPKQCVASAYNGVHEKFCLVISCFAGASMNENQLSELTAFSDGAVICGDETGVIHPFEKDNTVLPRYQMEAAPGSDFAPDPVEIKTIRSEISKYIKGKK